MLGIRVRSALFCWGAIGAFLCAGDASSAPPGHAFAERLLRAMEYIDYPDILVAVAAGNGSPWQRYDKGERRIGRNTPFEDRWNKAIEFSPGTSTANDLRGIQGTLSETPNAEFRGTPIDHAGGDIDKDAFGHGFDRLTLKEAAELKANPLLSVTLKPDPYNTARPGQTVLAKYRYPSAGTWQKFRDLLSPALVEELEVATSKGLLEYKLEDPNSVTPEFRRLNVKILHELVSVADDPGAPLHVRYQRLVSVHPFDDYNGRSLRLWYRAQNGGKPLFLLNFYCDLYCSEADFAAEAQRGQRALALLRSALAREAAASADPKFYDTVPEFFSIVADTPAPKDSRAFLSESKRWLLNPANSQRIDQKRFDEVFDEYEAWVQKRFPGAAIKDCRTLLRALLR